MKKLNEFILVLLMFSLIVIAGNSVLSAFIQHEYDSFGYYLGIISFLTFVFYLRRT